MSPWSRWVAFTGREVDSRPLRLVRVLVPLCILGDLFAMWRRDALDAVLLPASLGGLSETASPQAWFPDTAWAGPLVFGVLLLTMPLAVAGVQSRAALIGGLLASAQLGHLYLPGDRAIDRLMRTVMMLLVFSSASDRRPPARIAAWPADLIRWILVIVYLQAGVVKLDARPGFLNLEMPELYTIMASPVVGRLDPVFWADYPLLFVLGGAGTLVLELSAPLLLTRHARYWAIFGAAMHVGIALTMELGVFSFGMLSLYPVLLSPWTERALDRLAPWLPAGWGPADAEPAKSA